MRQKDEAELVSGNLGIDFSHENAGVDILVTVDTVLTYKYCDCSNSYFSVCVLATTVRVCHDFCNRQ